MIPTLALLSTLAAATSLASAAPSKRADDIDTSSSPPLPLSLAACPCLSSALLLLTVPFSRLSLAILQYALTLEHLENKFYSEAVAKFSQKDFENAGFDGWVYRRVKQSESDLDLTFIDLAWRGCTSQTAD
jgi:hypothetical protein